MVTAWKNTDGKVIVDAAGRVILCDTCPCTAGTPGNVLIVRGTATDGTTFGTYTSLRDYYLALGSSVTYLTVNVSLGGALPADLSPYKVIFLQYSNQTWNGFSTQLSNWLDSGNKRLVVSGDYPTLHATATTNANNIVSALGFAMSADTTGDPLHEPGGLSCASQHGSGVFRAGVFYLTDGLTGWDAADGAEVTGGTSLADYGNTGTFGSVPCKRGVILAADTRPGSLGGLPSECYLSGDDNSFEDTCWSTFVGTNGPFLTRLATYNVPP